MKNSTGDDSKRFLGPTFCVWDVPETDLSIHLHLSTVEWLDYEITRSLTSPEAGAEVGGLLLGRIESDSRRRIIIEGFTPVPCEHQFGSVYHLSVSDRRLMQDQMARWHPGPGRNLYVVGYYRSHNRDAVNLDEEDILLAKECLGNSVSAILLIQPSSARLGFGAFFFCEGGRVELEPKLEFPLNRTRLSQRASVVASASAEVELQPRPSETRHLKADRLEPVHESLPERVPVRTVVPPTVAPSHTGRRLLWPALAVLFLVLGSIGYRYLQMPGRTPPVEPLDHALTELDLNAAVENNLLRISWNKNSPAIASAKQGILSIDDRGSRRQLTLSAEQLQTGALVYPPESDDVTIRLKVIGSERETTESARIVGGSRQAGPPPLLPATEESGARIEAAPATAAGRKLVPEPAPPAPKTSLDTPLAPSSLSRTTAPVARSEASKKADGRQPPAFAAIGKSVPVSTPPDVKTSTGTAQAQPSPPETPVAQPRSEAVEVQAQQPPAPPPTGQSAPPRSPVGPASEVKLPQLSESSARGNDAAGPTEATPKPPGQSLAPVPSRIEPAKTETSRSVPPRDSAPEAATPRNSLAGGSQSPTADYVAPQAVRRVAPYLPSSLRNLPVAGLQVEVKVYIDASGTVIRTEPISKGTSLSEYLSSIAADAARQWKFSPARRGNQNVPSETILHFHFGNSRE